MTHTKLSTLPQYMRLAALVAVGACDPTGGGSLTLFETCGDPACAAYDASMHTNPACTTEVAGDVCTVEGDGCDLQVDCNSELICATEDPQAQTGGCPISLASAKDELRPPAVSLEAWDVVFNNLLEQFTERLSPTITLNRYVQALADAARKAGLEF